MLINSGRATLTSQRNIYEPKRDPIWYEPVSVKYREVENKIFIRKVEGVIPESPGILFVSNPVLIDNRACIFRREIRGKEGAKIRTKSG